MTNKFQHVLVTGGAGFIGSHVVKMLCDKGYNVRVVDDLRFGRREFLDNRASFFKGSIDRYSIMQRALDGVDVVFHLAGSSAIHFSYEKPLDYFMNNFINGVKLLEAMRRKGVNKIIFSSTSSVYGEQEQLPIQESARTNPLNAYSASKLAFEEALSCYFHAYGIESVTFRYFNVYGPRDEVLSANRAIPIWIQAAIKKQPIPWYWKGQQVRDYIYVRDVAQAHLDVLGLRGIHCFNIGSGKAIVMQEILRTLENILGRRLKTIDMGMRKGDPMKSYADTSLIRSMTGWRPKVSLEVGLRDTLKYYSHKNY